jgi:hypothetical protein
LRRGLREQGHRFKPNGGEAGNKGGGHHSVVRTFFCPIVIFTLI